MCDLLFGIPSLDRLINPSSDRRSRFCTGDEPGLVCIMGPDGVGKSLLALHLASSFWADQPKGEDGAVFYISTDLKYSQAIRAWTSFGLHQPKRRYTQLTKHLLLPRANAQPEHFPKRNGTKDLALRWITPNSDSTKHQPLSLECALKSTDWKHSIQFVDLASDSAGDDWNMLNRLLGFLSGLNKNAPQGSHLVIVDAIEGLETMSGDHDIYGQVRSRRSRVTQLARLAKKARAHLVFVIEEIEPDTRLDEEFVADLVLRLRTLQDRDYNRRTVEIEKARGVAHVRGQHDFAIRGGTRPNTLDDPEIAFGPDDKQLSYILVQPSLHVHARTGGVPQRTTSPRREHFPPHLSLLDGMMMDAPDPTESGRLTVLVGDTGTYKSRLARAFLATGLDESQAMAALLVTTSPLTHGDMVDKLVQYSGSGVSSRARIESRLILRSITAQYLTPSGLLHLLEENAMRAVQVARGGVVRFVLDDWNGLLAAHPNLANDPKLLSSVVALSRTYGLDALFVGTQSGSPLRGTAPALAHDLRSLETRHIYTWPVRFFGTRLTAITTYPPASNMRPPLIYELRPKGSTKSRANAFDGELLEVDRHFSLYSGLDEGKPERVPLVVRLYAGYHNDTSTGEVRYLSHVRSLFGDLYSSGADNAHVVQFEPITKYGALQEFVHLLDNTQLDHTLVIQLDEFWSVGDDHLLMDLSDSYMKKETCWINRRSGQLELEANLEEDPDRAYQPLAEEVKEMVFKVRQHASGPPLKAGCTRAMFFNNESEDWRASDKKSKTRVPCHWDFGFLLARRDLWYRSRNEKLRDHKQVGSIWNTLCIDDARFSDQPDVSGNVSWPQFLEACDIVRSHEDVPSFDVDSTAETLTSLVLEMWLSDDGVRPRLGTNEWPSLRDLLRQYPPQLYRTLRELFAHLPNLAISRSLFELRSANPDSVASRHWYATATVAASRNKYLVPLRLPGTWSTRGDWHLCAARTSRSDPLAYRAIDRLTSRAMNLERLLDGIGLPVRNIAQGPKSVHVRTCLNSFDEATNVLSPILYGKLLQVGRNNEGWLWRSRIQNFQHDSYMFFRWLSRLYQEREKCFPAADETKSSVDYLLTILTGPGGVEIPEREFKKRADDWRPYSHFTDSRDLLIAALGS